MTHSHHFLQAIGLGPDDTKGLRNFAKSTGIPIERLKYFSESNAIPSGHDLTKILQATELSETALKLKLGYVDARLIDSLQRHAGQICELLDDREVKRERLLPPLKLSTEFGRLYQGDCIDLLAHIDSDSVDLVFADPPFNLNKLYPSGIDDDLKAHRYITWCEEWLEGCVRVLKPGGSLFLWNLPKWNAVLAGPLGRRLSFRHWIAVDIKCSLPISGRLYPSHYSLLYFTKGEKPNVFKPDRLPMEICPSCKADLRDYGGYKDKMNEAGVNLTDVWFDIPPVRHAKYKRRKDANELSIKLLDRVIEMATNPGDLVFDPFGGSGTTYVVAELKRRHWLGVEIGPLDDIERRFSEIEQEAAYLRRIREHLNALFVEKDRRERLRRGLWTSETVRAKKNSREHKSLDGELQFGE